MTTIGRALRELWLRLRTELAHELELHHERELGARRFRLPELRSTDDFVVSAVEPGSAWQALTLALVTSATTDSPLPLAPLFRVAHDPHTAVERPGSGAALPALPPLPELTEQDVTAIFSTWCGRSARRR